YGRHLARRRRDQTPDQTLARDLSRPMSLAGADFQIFSQSDSVKSYELNSRIKTPRTEKRILSRDAKPGRPSGANLGHRLAFANERLRCDLRNSSWFRPCSLSGVAAPLR